MPDKRRRRGRLPTNRKRDAGVSGWMGPIKRLQCSNNVKERVRERARGSRKKKVFEPEEKQNETNS